MQFDAYGHLTPYQPLNSDLAAVEAVFVAAFPDSRTRRPVFDQYLRYLDQLRGIVGGGFTQWLNGSFTTRNPDPRDIDFVTFLDIERTERHHDRLSDLRRTRLQPGSLTDGYFVAVYPEGHRLRVHYESDRLDWLEIFGKTQRTHRGNPRRNKGIIQLTF